MGKTVQKLPYCSQCAHPVCVGWRFRFLASVPHFRQLVQIFWYYMARTLFGHAFTKHRNSVTFRSVVCVSEFYAAKHVVLNLCLFVAPYLGEFLNQNLLPKCFTWISQSLKNMFIYIQYVCNAVLSCLTSMFECAYLSFLFETLRSRVKYKPVGMFSTVFLAFFSFLVLG